MNGLRIGCMALTGLAAPLFFVGAAAAQHVVQLPEYHVTSVATSVSVPDGGGAYLGGVNSAADGSGNQAIPGLNVRPFGNSAASRAAAGGGMWVGAQIHDLQGMDAAILGQANQNVVPFEGARGVGRGTSTGNSVAAMRADAAAEDAARQQQAVDNLEHARALLAERKPGVAKIYFQLAAKHGTGEIQQQAVAGLQALEHPEGAATVAGQAIPR